MSRIHGEYVADRGDAESILMSQIRAVEAIDQLAVVAHGDLFRMAIEKIQCHSAEHRIAESRCLLKLIARS